MRSEFYLIGKEKQKAQFFFWSKSYVNLAMKSLLIYIQRLILQLNRLHVYTSSKIWGCKDHHHFSFLLKYPLPKSLSWGLN